MCPRQVWDSTNATICRPHAAGQTFQECSDFQYSGQPDHAVLLTEFVLLRSEIGNNYSASDLIAVSSRCRRSMDWVAIRLSGLLLAVLMANSDTKLVYCAMAFVDNKMTVVSYAFRIWTHRYVDASSQYSGDGEFLTWYVSCKSCWKGESQCNVMKSTM